MGWVRRIAWLAGWVTLSGLMLLAGGSAHAAGTRAGTVIPNSVTVSFTYGGRAEPPLTASVDIVVAEVVNVVVTSQDSGPVPVNTPDASRVLTFVVTNTGNGTQTFRLTRNNAIEGDQFDPISVSPAAIFLESGAAPGFQASGNTADTPYTPGANDPVIPPDGSLVVYVISNIPGSLGTGALGNTSLSAASTIPGAAGAKPGTLLAAVGRGGTDVVVGSTRAQGLAVGSYLVAGVSVGVAKTVAAVKDPMGGTRVMPGALVTYRIALSISGIGTAESLIFEDPLPAYTSYVAGSLIVDGIRRADASGFDPASSAQGTVRVNFGNVIAPATRVLEFQVTVN